MKFILLPEDREHLLKSDLVVVVGLTAAGKTTVANELHEKLLKGHSLYHSDDYIDYGYKESLYAMMKDASYDPNPKKIIEGVQGYRFLRKCAELGEPKVDAVVVVSTSGDERQARYYSRGKGVLPSSFDKNLATVFADYLAAIAGKTPKPRIIQILT